jgi:hypothetical protein
MTNEDREFAEFLAKLKNKVGEIRKDFDKLSDKNKIKVIYNSCGTVRRLLIASINTAKENK